MGPSIQHGDLWGVPFAPAALLLLTAMLSGNLASPLQPWAVLLGQAILIGLVVLGIPRDGWVDPLRLGRTGRWVVLALFVVAAVSAFSSSLPRAAHEVLVVVPLMILAVPTLARCWSVPEGRRWATPTVAVVVLVVAVRSLVGVVVEETPGASLPFGHHNVLAAWLVVLLPLAGTRLFGNEGGEGSAQWDRASWALSVLALLAAGAALISSRSLAGALGLGAALWVVGRRRLWVAGAVAIGLAALGWSRWEAMIHRVDTSVLARWTYLEAAWRGVAERPVLGQGPGSFPWLVGLFHHPQPGVTPPDEIIGFPHSLVGRALFELGLVGLLVVGLVVGAWVLARHRARVVDPVLHRAGAAGLAGASVIAGFGLDEGLPATWWAVAVAAAAVLAAEEREEAPPWPARRASDLALRAGVIVLAGAVLGPIGQAAHLAGKASAEGDLQRRVGLLERAVDLDPSFPLYRFRLARDLEGGDRRDRAVAEALVAAHLAPGLGPLWLYAGRLNGDPDLLARACDRSPFSVVAPVLLAEGDPSRAVDAAARALLVDPRVLASTPVLEGGSWEAAVRRVVALSGLPPFWTDELTRAATQTESSGRRALWALEVDTDVADSLSMVAFRRAPWPATLASLEVDVGRFTEITEMELAGVVAFRETRPDLMQSGCRLGQTP